jgi:hypothetical protein
VARRGGFGGVVSDVKSTVSSSSTASIFAR